MNKFASFIALCSAALLLVACEKENGTKGGEQPVPTDANTVTFTIGGDQSATKSTAADPIDLSEESGIAGLTLTEEVLSLDDLYSFAPETKGTPVFTENLAQIHKNIAVTAYDGTTLVGGGKDISYDNVSGNVWSHTYAEPLPQKTLQFFVMAPAVKAQGVGTVSYNSDGTISFPYTSPASAANQADVLFSSLSMNPSDPHCVLLYHTLVGVKFKLAAAADAKIAVTKISNVTLKSLKNAGTCTVTPNYSSATNTSEGGNASNASGLAATKSAACSLWDLATTTANFSQDFTGTVDLTTTTSVSYPGAWNVDANKSGNLNAADASLTFFFVPQQLSDDVVLTLTYDYTDGLGNKITGATATVNFGTKLGNPTWKAGELRTYTLSITDQVNVDIDDTVTSGKKNNVTITNTGTATTYVRVAVIGNWFSELTAEEIAADTPIAITPCELTSYKTKVNSNWVEGEDGFWYYKYPVLGGHTICQANTIFTNVTFTETKPYANCHLEVAMPVQAVRAEDVSSAWGSVKIKDSSSSVTTWFVETPNANDTI